MSGAAVAILVAKARRRITARFEHAGATSPATAIAFTPRDHPIDRRMWRRMQRYGAVREAAPGRYYLDHDGLAAFRAGMRKRALGVMAVVSVAAAVVLALG